MANGVVVRQVQANDITAVYEIEQQCFLTDRLSKRSLKHFARAGSHDFIVLTVDERIVGYAIVLYREGTLLARLYSLAIDPVQRGKGYAQQLLDAAQYSAVERGCVYLRLEVNESNQGAIQLYQKHRYKRIGYIKAYYEDGANALKMEKRLQQASAKPISAPYYQQTTDFTCGPSSLMMALKTLNADYQMTRHEEIQIWREATTIFMTSGHGGCSPHGLALSAWRRGAQVSVYLNTDSVPFIDGVRSPEKKSVMALVHDEFLQQIAQTNVVLSISALDRKEIESLLQLNKPMLALISTWRFNRNKAPHWVYIAAVDELNVYINDPEQIDDEYLSSTDFQLIPIPKESFYQMAQFGQQKLRSLLVLN